MIKIKSIYQNPEDGDGLRVFVDDILPEKMSKQKTQIDLCLGELAPSAELNKWFNKDSKRWPEFEKRYRKELKNKSTLISIIRAAEKKNGTVTLLYSTENEEHNSAVVLRDKLQAYNIFRVSVDRTHG